MTEIKNNIENVRHRIRLACEKSGRRESEVQIIAVTKTVDASRVVDVVKAGIPIVGENRVQEAAEKFEHVKETCSWHLIGHLQTNKVRKALSFADVIQSVDSVKLAQKIQSECEKLERSVDVLIQVNTSRESSKSGVAPEDALAFAHALVEFPALHVKGLMTIGAFTEDETEIRRCFRELRRLRDEIQAANVKNIEMQHLSMGMTNDFEIAIEEGATMIRLGRVLFGERN